VRKVEGIGLLSLGVGFVLAVLAFLGKLGVREGYFDVCRSESCKVVQYSGFSDLFGFPITLFAILALGGVILLWFLRRKERALFILAFLVGCEAYLTFIEFYYLEGKCPLCIAFLSSLVIGFVFLVLQRFRQSLLWFMALGFLGLHFLFFFPRFDLAYTPYFDPKGKVIEVFLSPRESRILKELQGFSSQRGFQLCPRFVPQDPSSRREALLEMAKMLFSEPSEEALRLSERALRRNEEELKNFNGSLPLLVVKEKGEVKKVISGPNWREELEEYFSLPPLFFFSSP